MSLTAYRAAVVAGLKTLGGEAPLFRSVEPHGGRFDLEELKRFGALAPAARVAVLALRPAQELSSGRLLVTVRCATFVATRDLPALPRDVAALALVDAVLLAIEGNFWGDAAARRPAGLGAENLFGTTQDRTGVALWAVTWEQQVLLGGLDAETLDALELIAQTWPVGGEHTPNPEDNVVIPQDEEA
jgi:hypothetical protein